MKRALLAVLVLAAATPATAHVGPHEVAVRDNIFEPQRLSIDAGESVTWFAETTGHTVTSDAGVFDRALGRGETFSHTFGQNGAFYYYCRVHGSPGDGSKPGSGMWGVVIVGPALTVRDASALESLGTIAVPVELDRPSPEPVTVSLATSHGTASDEDYAPASGTVTFAPGETTRAFVVALIDDTAVEPNEWFTVDISGIVGAVTLDSQARATIKDDDGGGGCVVPSTLCPTLDAAIGVALPRAEIYVEPGIYRLSAPVVVDVDGVSIRATGPGVVLEPAMHMDAGVRVVANDVHLEGFTVQKFPVSGIEWRGVKGFSATGLRAVGKPAYGFRALGSARGVLTDLYASGAERAGVAISACDPCDVVVSRLTAELNFIGLEGSRATSVIVRGSTFARNRNGIALRGSASASAERALQAGAHLIGNTITGSGDSAAPRPPSASAKLDRGDLVSGVAVWVAGGANNVIEHNDVSGGRYGVVVAGFGLPAIDNSIRRNSFAGPGSYALAWDGVGADVCFSDNDGDGADQTSPPSAQVLYDCARPTVGIPNPVLWAELLRDTL